MTIKILKKIPEHYDCFGEYHHERFEVIGNLKAYFKQETRNGYEYGEIALAFLESAWNTTFICKAFNISRALIDRMEIVIAQSMLTDNEIRKLWME